MKPVVTVAQMRALDAASPVPEEVLIDRAGAAVARTARRMLGGTYGRRVVVVCGKGNNGADGRVAAARLRTAGVRVRILPPDAVAVPSCDLVIDAAYGSGFHGTYQAPKTSGVPVLSVDIPSGVNGDTGEADDGAVRADVTVTFAALKPGLLLGRGAELCGTVEIADIGLPLSTHPTSKADSRSYSNAEFAPLGTDPTSKADSRSYSNTEFALLGMVVEEEDVRAWFGPVERESHKWKAAVAVIAGSPGMMGAALFAARGASRAGAGMVRLGIPGLSARELPVSEAVAMELPQSGWDADVIKTLDRVHALVIGPGLGRDPKTIECIRRLVAQAEVPVIVDGDGLYAMDAPTLRARTHPSILTPHEGEFRRLAGHAPEADRIADVRTLAKSLNSTVLLKGSTTVIASPSGDVLLSTTGDARLATAGTGDVLSGMIGAFVARATPPQTASLSRAAAMAAYVHGAAARDGYRRGFMAGDLPDLVAKWLSA